MKFYWQKEKVLKVAFNKSLDGIVRNRIPEAKDKETIITNKKGKKTTLWDDKIEFPFKLDEDVMCIVWTDKRKFSFKIRKNYVWNGADIPAIFEILVGSKQEIQFLAPSMVHDFLLEYKNFIYKEVLNEEMSVAEYRRLTSLIFRQLLKNYNVKATKTNVMAWAVDVFQMTFNKGEWKIK